MAHRGIYSHILVNQFDFSGISTDMAVEITGNSIDATTFQSTAKKNVVAPTESTIRQTSLWRHDTATPTPDVNVDAAMNTYLGNAAATVSALIMTEVAACPSYTQQNCSTATMSIEAATAELLRINGDWVGDSARRGLRVFGKHSTWSNGVVSSAAASTGIDTGAAGSNGGIAILHLHTITGATTGIDITLQSDSDSGFGTAATEASFTMTAVGVQVVNMTGTVNRYLRINTTDLGGATSFVATVLAVVRGVTASY